MLTDSSTWDGNPRLPATWRVLLAMLRHASLSQAELREVTGLSHPIIVQQVARLRHAGLITFGQPIVGQPGRPPVPMSFNWRFRRLLTLDVHRTGITAQVTDLAGAPLEDAQIFPVNAWTRDTLTSALVSAIRETLLLPGAPWAAIGLCVPAFIDVDLRTILDWPGSDGWSGFDLGGYLQEACGHPVLVESAANVLASMMATTNPERVSSVIAISVRHAPPLQAGLLVDGRLVRGTRGRAGDLACVPTAGAASCSPLAALFSDEAAVPRHAGIDALGCLLASLATVLDAGRVVVQGDTRWSDDETAELMATLDRFGFSDAQRQLVLLNDTPAQTVDTLLGLARAVSGHLLDLQNGQLTNWADEALVAVGSR